MCGLHEAFFALEHGEALHGGKYRVNHCIIADRPKSVSSHLPLTEETGDSSRGSKQLLLAGNFFSRLLPVGRLPGKELPSPWLLWGRSRGVYQ